MPIYDYRCVCGDKFEVAKSIHDATAPEHCPQCGALGERVFTKFYFNGAAVQNAEWNPAFGQVVNNKYHRSELAKRNNMVEIGNDYVSPDSVHKEMETKKADDWRRGWERV